VFAKVLRGDAAISSIFPNRSDIGGNREVAYVEFLKAICRLLA